MPVKITNKARGFLSKVDSITEQTMVQILAVILANAKFYAPLDTGALQNSDFRSIETLPTGLRGRVGYTAGYAAALHERTDWQPQQPQDRSPPGGGYNPNARPAFLKLGIDASRSDIQRIIRANYGRI